MRKISLKGAKQKAWDSFAKYIKHKYSRQDGYVECITCAQWKPISEMHAGHFIDGRSGAVLFDERIVWPQCAICNVWLHGNKYYFTRFMEKKFGRKKVDEIVRELKTKIIKRTISDYIEIFEKYSKLLKQCI